MDLQLYIQDANILYIIVRFFRFCLKPNEVAPILHFDSAFGALETRLPLYTTKYLTLGQSSEFPFS